MKTCALNFPVYCLLTTFYSLATVASGVKWQRKWVSSSASLRATEGELKLMELLKEKLNPTYLAVEDMSGMTI